MKKRIEKAFQQAQRRIAKMPAGIARKQQEAKLQKIGVIVGGANLIFRSVQQKVSNGADVPTPIRDEFHRLRGVMSAYAELQVMLDKSAAGLERDAMVLEILQRSGGLLTSAEWLATQLAILAKKETGASFDRLDAEPSWRMSTSTPRTPT